MVHFYCILFWCVKAAIRSFAFWFLWNVMCFFDFKIWIVTGAETNFPKAGKVALILLWHPCSQVSWLWWLEINILFSFMWVKATNMLVQINFFLSFSSGVDEDYVSCLCSKWFGITYNCISWGLVQRVIYTVCIFFIA